MRIISLRFEAQNKHRSVIWRPTSFRTGRLPSKCVRSMKPKEGCSQQLPRLHLDCANAFRRHTRIWTILSKRTQEINIFRVSNHMRDHEMTSFFFFLTFGGGRDDKGMDIHNRDRLVCLNEASLCLWGGRHRDNKYKRQIFTAETNGTSVGDCETLMNSVQTLLTKERLSQERRTV